jgi:hypothetical protein
MSSRILIAALNSSDADRKRADLICTGKNDEQVLNQAITSLVHGGTIQLLDGDYYIDSFSCEDHSAIFFGFNDGLARVINIIGDTENKSYNTRFGVTLHVTEAAFRAMKPGITYRVFYGASAKPESPGDFYTYTHVNNVNFENFYIYYYDASRSVIGIDCINFGSCFIRQVGIYTESYFQDRFMHLKPATPCKGSVGVSSCHGSNDEMSRVGYDTVNVGGLYIGFQFNGVDHLIVKSCAASRCCYGYVFSQSEKTIMMLNCSDEGNTHMPRFSGIGHLTNIDYNIERFNADFIPDDPEGDTEALAVESLSGGWHGVITYTLQGKAFGINRFWKEGNGVNFRTINLCHNRNTRPENPEYLESYFDTQTNRMLIWNGKNWVDALGNPCS